MTDRLSIGEFAELTELSQRALRLYGQHGLLIPASVDPDTGYRWYDTTQIDRAKAIKAARAAGMPLADIAALLEDEPEEAHRRLDRHGEGVEERVRAARSALAHLHQLIGADRIKEEPMDPFERGNRSYFHERRIEEALTHYAEVPVTDPRYATAQRYIGHNIYGREWRRWSEGLPYLEEAYRAAPTDRKVLEDLGRALIAVGRLDDGRALLEEANTHVAAKALEMLPGDPEG